MATVFFAEPSAFPLPWLFRRIRRERAIDDVMRIALAVIGAFVSTTALAQEAEKPKLLVVDQPAQPTATGATVHAESTDPRAHIQAHTRYDEWTTVCELPCDRPLDSQFVFRIGGRGLRSTPIFKVPVGGHFTLHAEMAPRRNIILGITFTAVGAGMLLTGALEFALAALTRSMITPPCSGCYYSSSAAAADQHTREQADINTTLGIGFLVAGGLMMIPGLVFFGLGTRSTLQSTQETSSFRLRANGFAF